MIKRFFSYLMIASIVAVGFTACNKDDDNTPKEKTAEEIKAENLAKFKELIGTGIGNAEYDVGMTMTEVKDITEKEFDKIDFDLTQNKEVQHYILFDGTNYVFNQENIQVKGSVFDFKVEDGVYTIYVDKDSAKKVYYNGELTDGSHAIKIIYNSKDKTVIQFWGGYQGENYMGTIINKFKAEPYTAPKASSEKAVVKTRSVASRSTTSFTGVHYVYVELKSTHWTSGLPALILKPKGYHYVKFTQKSNGKIRAQFCDSTGTVSGDNAPADYYYSTTKHFWKNAMPMALNLYDVDFSYTNGTISRGTYVMAHARPNNNEKGKIPAFFLGGLKNQNSGADADIITTTGNTADNFVLKVKLDFELPFDCVITKQ